MTSELEFIYRFLIKCIPDDMPLPDEVVAIREGREEIACGEYVAFEDINWD